MLAIALGDPTGIGPEISLKAVAGEVARDEESYLLIGDEERVLRLNETLGTKLPLGGRVRIVSPGAKLSGSLSPGVPEAARAAVSWLKHGAELCLRGEADA